MAGIWNILRNCQFVSLLMTLSISCYVLIEIGCRLTESMSSDQCNGWERKINDRHKQEKRSGAVSSRVGVRLVQFEALEMRS